jgi:hypothetical protein
MNRAGVEDPRLSWKAVGLLAYIISKPDGWVVHEKDLINRHTDGRDAVRSGLKELRECGYMEKVAVRDETGKIIRWEAHIYECPKATELSEKWNEGDDIIDENHNTGFPPSGEPTFWETRPYSNNDSLEKKEKKKEGPPPAKIPLETSGGLFAGETKPQTPGSSHPRARALAGALYDGLAAKRKIMRPPNLNLWERCFSKFLKETGTPPDEVQALVNWYVQHAGEPYIVRAYSAESFCERYVDLVDNHSNWKSDQQKKRERGELPESSEELLANSVPLPKFLPAKRKLTDSEYRALIENC